MRLEEAFENETGPIKHAITNGLAYQIDPVARTETNVLSGKFFGKTRRIKRVQVRLVIIFLRSVLFFIQISTR